MMSLRQTLALGCTALGLAPGGLFAAPPALDGLVSNPPFGRSPAAASASASAEAPLEFRGVLVDGGERYFSLYEVTTKTSLWVELQEPGNPFIVQAYDEAKGTVTVEYQGRSLTVALKQARIVALPPPPAGPATAAAPAVPPPANAALSDEATRITRVQEEIRRRRAIRAQAMQQQNAATPLPVPARP